jgi:hypothetical protein
MPLARSPISDLFGVVQEVLRTDPILGAEGVKVWPDYTVRAPAEPDRLQLPWRDKPNKSDLPCVRTWPKGFAVARETEASHMGDLVVEFCCYTAGFDLRDLMDLWWWTLRAFWPADDARRQAVRVLLMIQSPEGRLLRGRIRQMASDPASTGPDDYGLWAAGLITFPFEILGTS